MGWKLVKSSGSRSRLTRRAPDLGPGGGQRAGGRQADARARAGQEDDAKLA